jgi:hypothetical protein
LSEEKTMSNPEQKNAGQAEKTQTAAAERPAADAPPPPTTQAERAVMHPPPSPGLGDRHDPDWRYYHACGA